MESINPNCEHCAGTGKVFNYNSKMIDCKYCTAEEEEKTELDKLIDYEDLKYDLKNHK